MSKVQLLLKGQQPYESCEWITLGMCGYGGGGCYGRYLLLPPPDRLPSLRARYHFLLAQAEAGVPSKRPVISQGAPMKPDQLITSQGTVTARFNNKKEPTPQVTAFPGMSTYWPLPLVSCRAMKPGAIPTASAVKNNHSRKFNVFPPCLYAFHRRLSALRFRV